jgi:MHS family proline/betaine transporter-like MFS transporter
MKKVVISGMLGNGLEWYDYALYGYMAPILGKLFFPAQDETVQLLATFGVFAVGFLFRPLGAIMFGMIGDKYGRKAALVTAILMMAIPTGCIGLLPTYAQIGVAAPILLTLIRVFQGMSLGGEFSGSITYIVEHAPDNKRGIAGSASVVSLMLGFLLGSFVSLGFSASMSVEDFESWGWRVPFLLGIVIGMIGFYIRTHCSESPAYEEAKAADSICKTPVREVFKRHPKAMLQAFAFYLTVTMPFYLTSIYLMTFTEKFLGRSYTEALTINTFTMLAMILTTIAGAMLSDKYGRRKVLMLAAGGVFLAAIPAFLLMQQGSLALIAVAQIGFGLVLGFYLGPIPAVLVELFPTSVRFTGMALAYNAAAALFGGTAPMVCVWLLGKTQDPLSIAAYVMLCNLCSLTALWLYKDKWREKLG